MIISSHLSDNGNNLWMLPVFTVLLLEKVIIPKKCILCKSLKKKSRIRETSNLSTDADRRTDTILEILRDLYRKKIIKNGVVDASTRPRTHPSFLGLHACNKMDAWAMDALHPPLVFRAPRV